MRTAFFALVTLVLSLFLASTANAALRVVATTPDLSSIVRQLGGGDVQVTTLALPTQDPHFVDPRPDLALSMSKADLLILTGAGLEEGWLPALLAGCRNPRIQFGARGHLDGAMLVGLLEVPSGRVDRSQGDVHPEGNPHYTYDPRRVEVLAVGIGKRLAELDPAHRPDYLARTKSFVDGLRTARARWEAKLVGARRAKVIAYHRSLAYLADWLGLQVVEHVEPRAGIPPNPAHVARVIATAKGEHVRVLLQEPWYPANTSQLIATKAGIPFVRLPGQPASKQTYVEYMDELTGRLANAVGR